MVRSSFYLPLGALAGCVGACVEVQALHAARVGRGLVLGRAAAAPRTTGLARLGCVVLFLVIL